jgi:tetratricopeptide (TPR) repeat protein
LQRWGVARKTAAALERHPDALDGAELNGIAKTLYGAKAFDTAILLLNKAIEADPEMASAWGLRGDCYFQKGDYDNAIADFKKTLELDPDKAKGWNFLAYAYFNKKDYVQALSAAAMAVNLTPDNAGYWASRAKFYEAAGKYDNAAADCQKALELDPALESAKQILERCKKKAAGNK